VTFCIGIVIDKDHPHGLIDPQLAGKSCIEIDIKNVLVIALRNIFMPIDTIWPISIDRSKLV
jgi:hypothetical protein